MISAPVWGEAGSSAQDGHELLTVPSGRRRPHGEGGHHGKVQPFQVGLQLLDLGYVIFSF